jgi:hypothetical protein
VNAEIAATLFPLAPFEVFWDGGDLHNPREHMVSEEHVPTDWAALRAEAEKLGITLSELQQKKRQSKLQSDAKQARIDAATRPDTGSDKP